MSASSYTFLRLAFLAIAALSLVLLLLIYRKNKSLLPAGTKAKIGTVLAAFVLLISVGVWSVLTFVFGAPFVKAGQAATPFAFKVVADDAPKNLADYKGQVVLLNYWATW